MDEKIDTEKYTDDFMLPGFRFHPTDEELVGFYLRRKLQQRSLPIELIKQLDIYKHDPWDLPKYASTGEKEWYFYCPRDRKYRNSTRPNRVTGSGFWKATGTDRPIYSSDGAKCIGLKKSLVFYRGRAAKGIKTDWMMHEFRLPSATDGPPPPKRIVDKGLPPTDSWAICRIFKKTNSLAHRALSHSWAASLSETTSSPDAFTYSINQPQFIITENDLQNSNIPSLNMPPYKPMFTKPHVFASSQGDYFPENFILSPRQEVSGTTNKSTTTTTTVDLTSMLFNVSPAYEGPQMNHHGFSTFSSQIMQGEDEQDELRKRESATVHNQWGNIRSMGFPFSLPSSAAPSHVPWDSPPTCPSEISSTTYPS